MIKLINYKYFRYYQEKENIKRKRKSYNYLYDNFDSLFPLSYFASLKDIKV
jgi:hypothetical protein